MNIQQACEVIESLLERDTKQEILTTKEFNALNKTLLECQIKLGYEAEA